MAKGEFFKSLPPWAKGVVAVAIIGGIAYVVYKVSKKSKQTEAEKDQKEVSQGATSVLNDLLKKGDKLSFPNANYAATCNTIKRLLEGCETLVSEKQAVEEVIKVVKKPIDWYKLVATFGTKDIDNCGIGTGDTNYDLISLLKDQLGSPLVGDLVNGKRYWNVPALTPLTEYLAKFKISI
jgi:hypothetical protein